VGQQARVRSASLSFHSMVKCCSCNSLWKLFLCSNNCSWKCSFCVLIQLIRSVMFPPNVLAARVASAFSSAIASADGAAVCTI
jgi:hypothetical protein